MASLHLIVLIIGMIFASLGILLFYLKEKNRNFSSTILAFLVRNSEYIKILASICATSAVFIHFFSNTFSSANLILLIAFCFTVPGDIILSRDLTKLFVAIPLFGVAYLLMAVRALMVIFSHPINVPLLIGSLVLSIIVIVIVLIRTIPKLNLPILRYAVIGYSLIVCTFLFTGLSVIFQLIEIPLGLSFIILVGSDIMAVSHIDKPVGNKPLYDLLGGVLYFVPLFIIVVFFTNM